MSQYNKTLVTEYYNRAASRYYEKQDGYISSKQKITIMSEVLRAVETFARTGNRVLDLGCGPGLYAKVFLERGYEYWGIDISPEVIEEARWSLRHTQNSTNARFMVGDTENLDVPSASFDVVLAVWVLEYLETDQKAIREMLRVLKKGGIAVVVLNNQFSYNRGMRKLVLSMAKKLPAKYTEWRHSFQEFAVRYHNPQEFRAQMETEGFSFVDERFFDFHIVPFNVKVPRFYFRIDDALSSLFSFLGVDTAFARYVAVFRAQT